MRGREGKMGLRWAGAEQESPHPRWTLALPTLRPFPFKVLGRNSPAPQGRGTGVGGWDWSELLGEET